MRLPLPCPPQLIELSGYTGGRVLEGGARDAAAVARFLDEPRETFGTQVRIAERDSDGKVVGSRDAHVWHTSLSLHPDEPALSDERWGQIAERFISEMGFAGEGARAQCRWVAVRHGESTGGSDHVHLVVGLVAEDGSKASVHFERKRAQQAARLLEREFGLRELESRGRGAGSRGLEPGEIAADRRRGVGVGERGEHAERSSRQRLERVVRACAGASRTESEFVARLREQGVNARARYGTGGTSSVVGYSVRLAGPSEGRARTVWYGGGRLARDLSLPALRRGWGQEHGEQQRAVAEWGSGSALVSDRPPSARRSSGSVAWCGIAARWRSSGCGSGCAPRAPIPWRARTRRVRAPRCWRRVVDLEGEQPGALARAAGSSPAQRSCPPRRRRRGAAAASRASGLALFMLAAGRPDSAVGWLLVCRELGLLAGEIGRVHRARGELQRVHEIETDLNGELQQIRARIDADRPDSGPVELDAESEAARRAREPLGPATREAPQRPVDVDDVEAVKRLIDPTRRRPRHR